LAFSLDCSGGWLDGLGGGEVGMIKVSGCSDDVVEIEGVKMWPDEWRVNVTHWQAMPEPPKEDATSGNH